MRRLSRARRHLCRIRQSNLIDCTISRICEHAIRSPSIPSRERSTIAQEVSHVSQLYIERYAEHHDVE